MLVYKKIEKRIDRFTLGLVLNGILLVLLGVLIVWTDFMLRLVVGMITMIVAYGFFYMAYKVNSIKKEIGKFLKM